ncbi:MAG: putative metal-binding motif-containing protein [Myxococcota bacterium]
MAGAVVVEGEPIAVLVSVLDADDAPEDIALTWSGSADGQGPATPDANGQAAFDLTGVPQGDGSVTVRATDPEGLVGAATVRFSVRPRPVDADMDGVLSDVDCNDQNPDVFPGAPEICDELDNDCDDEVDEGVLLTFYRDSDNDGAGDADTTIEACEVPSGHVENVSDCDDGDPQVTANGIAVVVPTDGEFGVLPERDVAVELLVPDVNATITVRDSTNTAVAGVTMGTGPGAAVFEPVMPWAAGETFTVEVAWSCGDGGTAQTTFTAADFSSPVNEQDLLTRSYRLDLFSGLIVQPPGFGPVIKPLVGPAEFLLGATSAQPTELDLLIAGAAPLGQDLCTETVSVPAVDFSNNPDFRFAASNVTFFAQGLPVDIENLDFEGIYESNLGTVVAQMRGDFDTRNFSVAVFGASDTACTLAAPLGATCVACADGGIGCIELEIENVIGTVELGALQERSAADISADPNCP